MENELIELREELTTKYHEDMEFKRFAETKKRI